MPIAEAQSQWVADLLGGRAILPPEWQMNQEIARYQAVTARRYARSTGPAIQVDFLAYLREIRKERRAGARRSPGRQRIIRPAGAGALLSGRPHDSMFPLPSVAGLIAVRQDPLPGGM